MSDPKDLDQEELTPYTVTADREKKEYFTLGGTAMTVSGKLSKTNYFRWIGHDLDQYDQIKLTPEQAKRLDTHLRKLSTGSSAAVPMLCAANKCILATRCPLQQMGKAQLGAQCVLENQLLKEFTVRYFEEFDVDPNNFTEVTYVNELAEIMIMEMRLNMILAKPENSELVIDQIISVTEDGTEIKQKQLTPYLLQKEKLQNRRSKIIKLMVGDRQEKYKKEAALKVKTDTDPSSKMAKMRSQLEKLQRQLDVSDNMTDKKKEEGYLTPDDIIGASFDEE